jgi:hypothetical protein
MQTKSNILKAILFLSLSLFIFSCENNVEEEMIVLDEITNGNNNGNNGNGNNGNGNGNGNGNSNDPCADITFSAKVKPIIDSNCLQCHGNGGTFPNLTSFSNISRNAGSIKSAVVSRRMPQGGSLSQADIDAIACWVDAGAKND